LIWKITTFVLLAILVFAGLYAARFQLGCWLSGGTIEKATVSIRQVPGLTLNMQACNKNGKTLDARIRG
jgi:hypothetical protein